jgi:CDP-diacylglycerol---serine O-phosphatidyltransferase
MNVLRSLGVADFFTVGNFACGMAGIFLAAKGHFAASCLLAIAAVVLDFLDGKVARLLNVTSELGKQLDSLADLVSFGVWPAVLGFFLGLDSPLSILVLIAFAMAGMLRLARFNVTSVKHFEGVPITTNGLLFPIIYFASLASGYSWNSYMLLVYLLMAALMVSTFRVKKL